MKRTLLVLLTALVLAACSKVNQENFLKVREGMSAGSPGTP